MPPPSHVIKGVVSQIAAVGPVRALVLGNSIHLTNSSRNLTQGIVKQCPLPIIGGVCAAEAQSGMPVTGNINSFTGLVGVRPGEAFPDGSRGSNLRLTRSGTGDGPSFGSPITCTAVDGVGLDGSAWATNKNLRFTAAGETDPAATGYTSGGNTWRLQGRTRANAVVNNDFINTPTLDVGAPRRLWSRVGTTFASGSGGFTAAGLISMWGGTEAGAVKVNAMSLEVADATSGLFIAYAGYGSWPLEAGASEAGVSITADPPTYQAGYTDAALQLEYQLFRYNLVICCGGANEQSPEQFALSLAATRARHFAAAAAAGVPRPAFVTVSQYQALGDDTSTWAAMNAAATAQAIADDRSEHVDFFNHTLNARGLWSTWKDALLDDTIHPSSANSILRTDFGNVLWQTLLGPRTIGLGAAASPPGGGRAVVMATGKHATGLKVRRT